MFQDFSRQGLICYPPPPAASFDFGSLQPGFLGWLRVRKHILKGYTRKLITVSILVYFISLLTAVRIHLNFGRSLGFSDQHSDIIENLENRIIRIIVALQITFIIYWAIYVPTLKKMWKGLFLSRIPRFIQILSKMEYIQTIQNGGSKTAEFPF